MSQDTDDIHVSETQINNQQSVSDQIDQIDQNDVSEEIQNGSKDVYYEILDY